MLKGLIICPDGLEQHYIFKSPEKYPNLSKLISKGASGAYSSHVKRIIDIPYFYSEINWTTIHTGLEPWVHNVRPDVNVQYRSLQMKVYENLKPFWEALNDNGLKVGIWADINCANPTEIDGYVISVDCEAIEDDRDDRQSPRILQVNKKDKHILDRITGTPPPRLYPKTLSQLGLEYSHLIKHPEKAYEEIKKYRFQESIENFKTELDYFYDAITCTQAYNPVDVLYFFTPTTDVIGHFAMFEDDADTIIEAYGLLDNFVGRLRESLVPEITLVFSDHGMDPLNVQVKAKDPALMRAAFTSADDVLWLPNNNIVFTGRNGGLYFTTHGFHGFFTAAGKGLRHTSLSGMHITDIYPTLLEIFGCEVPEGRSGYVHDIFDRPLVNANKIYPAEQKRKRAAVYEACNVETTCALLNELYVKYRFIDFFVVGRPKFSEIYLNNPRVSGFVSEDNFNANDFDVIFEGEFDAQRKLTGVIRR